MRQFRTVPQGGTDARTTSEVIRGIMDGKTNNTGTITLNTNNATTTALYDDRIGYDSVIILVPKSAAAFDDNAPYGAFQDSTDQTIASTTTAYPMTLDTVDYSNGVFISDSSKINVRNYGIYNLQWSGQFQNSDTVLQDVSVWLRKNGTDITGSTGFIAIPNSHGGGDGHLIVGWNYFVEMNAGDYIQIMWSATNTSVSIQTYPTGTSPTRPSTASVVATMQYVAPSATTNVYVSDQQQGSAIVNHWANSTSDKTYSYVVIG
jgi:hypothetical protein